MAAIEEPTKTANYGINPGLWPSPPTASASTGPSAQPFDITTADICH